MTYVLIKSIFITEKEREVSLMDIQAMIVEYNSLIQQEKTLREEKRKLQFEIDKKINKTELDTRVRFSKDTGTVEFALNNHLIKVTRPKIVKWSQEELENLALVPELHQHIKMKYNVSETSYNLLSPALQETFDSARTISQGSPKYEIK